MAQLPNDLHASRLARSLMQTAMMDRLGPERSLDAAICLSELVSNVVVHVEEPPVLVAHLDCQEVVVQVSDRHPIDEAFSRLLRELRETGRTSDLRTIGGRGFQIVDLLADDWGVHGWANSATGGRQDRLAGKTLWFAMEAQGARELADFDLG